jgi:hypothetical protein
MRAPQKPANPRRRANVVFGVMTRENKSVAPTHRTGHVPRGGVAQWSKAGHRLTTESHLTRASVRTLMASGCNGCSSSKDRSHYDCSVFLHTGLRCTHRCCRTHARLCVDSVSWQGCRHSMVETEMSHITSGDTTWPEPAPAGEVATTPTAAWTDAPRQAGIEMLVRHRNNAELE